MSSQVETAGSGPAQDGRQNGDSIVFTLDVEETLKSLLAQEDTDHDMQITIDDTGPKSFSLPLPDGSGEHQVQGTYMLSNLLQELTLAKDAGQTRAAIPLARLTENPVRRLSRRIADDFWDMLTRRIDASSVERAALDTKDWTDSPRPRIYIPHGEPKQFEFYKRVAVERPEINLDVQMLPEAITPELLRDLSSKPGLLAIAMEEVADEKTGEPTLQGVPFVVPGGRFNEFYGWDSYFIALGLLADGRVDLARGMVDNFCFCVKHYGKILNATRSYYLCRSQPPFLTDMALRVYGRIEREEGAREWLRRSLLAAIKEYSNVWTAEPRFDAGTGLSRYLPEGLGVPMETEPGHFKHVLDPYAEKAGMTYSEYAEAYTWGRVKEPALDEYFKHDRAVRESGHDTSYRLEGRCANIATVDLNCLLYKYETDLARAIAAHFDGELAIPAEFSGGALAAGEVQTSALWAGRAERRRRAIWEYCWDAEKGMFFDYDVAKGERTGFESATMLWALWAGVASEEQAASLVLNALPKLESPGGLVSTTKDSVGELGPGRPQKQWDYPYGWAPQQILAWEGLRSYGFETEAKRLAYRWLMMVTGAFRDFNGVVVEKYDVRGGAAPQRVEAEYGNQGLGFKGVAKEGFGWVNASYVVGLQVLDEDLRRALEDMVPYDEYKKSSG